MRLRQISDMGGASSSGERVGLPRFEWEWTGNHTGIDLFQRKSDSLIAERRVVSLDHRFPLQTELKIYQFRSSNDLGLVKVYQVDGVEREQKGSCGCSEAIVLSVYSERVEFRLSDLPQLTFPEALFLLREALNAFHHVYQRFGPLHINSELIGINDQHKVRVWVNENWALNHPSHKIPILLTINNLHLPPELRDQREMVTNILQVIEDKTEQGRYPLGFTEGLYAAAVNFREAKRFIAKFTSQDYQDYIPEIIKRSRVIASQRQISSYSHGNLSSYSHGNLIAGNSERTALPMAPTGNRPTSDQIANSAIGNPSASSIPVKANNGNSTVPFRSNQEVRIVESMYQQYISAGNNSTQLSGPSSSYQPPSTHHNRNNYIPEAAGFPSVANSVVRFSQPLENNSLASLQPPAPANLNAYPANLNSYPPNLSAYPPNLNSPASMLIPHQHHASYAPTQWTQQPSVNFQQLSYLKFKFIEDPPPYSAEQPRHDLRQAVIGGRGEVRAEQHAESIRAMLKQDSIQSSEHKASYKIGAQRAQVEPLGSLR